VRSAAPEDRRAYPMLARSRVVRDKSPTIISDHIEDWNHDHIDLS